MMLIAAKRGEGDGARDWTRDTTAHYFSAGSLLDQAVHACSRAARPTRALALVLCPSHGRWARAVSVLVTWPVVRGLLMWPSVYVGTSSCRGLGSVRALQFLKRCVKRSVKVVTVSALSVIKTSHLNDRWSNVKSRYTILMSMMRWGLDAYCRYCSLVNSRRTRV